MKNIKFKKLELGDKEAIEAYFRKYSSLCLSIYTFSTLISWQEFYNYQWAIADDTLLIKFTDTEDGQDHLFQPVGEFPKSLQDKIIEYARTLSRGLAIYGVSETFISGNPEFVSFFEIEKQRDLDNYIYLAEDLASLKGRNYQPKRNLIKQFEENNVWTSEPITPDNISECLEVVDRVYGKDVIEKDKELERELGALEYVLKNFVRLGQSGILIKVSGAPVAFSIYEQLNLGICAVHFEKAVRDYKGLYQLINREAAKAIFSKGYKYINREEDLGIEGLRKAKLSYHPIKLCPSNALVFKK